MELKYIIGDLVKYKVGSLEFIAEITNTSKYGYCFKGVSDDISGTLCKEFAKDIPLTPEILEKNGWVKDMHRHCLDEMPAEAYEKKDFPLTHFNVTFGKKRIQASHDCLFVRNLKYVSDLQHLLFGLGLNSEMEV